MSLIEASQRMRRLRNVECLRRPFLDDLLAKQAGINISRPTSVFLRPRRRPSFVGCCDKSPWAMLSRTARSVPVSRISGLEEQMAQLRRGKKRKAVLNPNRRFIALAEAPATGEALPDSKEAEIEVDDVDKEVKSIITVGIGLEDEREDLMVVIKHCQRI
jgi:hypothetical protein